MLCAAQRLAYHSCHGITSIEFIWIISYDKYDNNIIWKIRSKETALIMWKKFISIDRLLLVLRPVHPKWYKCENVRILIILIWFGSMMTAGFSVLTSGKVSSNKWVEFVPILQSFDLEYDIGRESIGKLRKFYWISTDLSARRTQHAHTSQGT